MSEFAELPIDGVWTGPVSGVVGNVTNPLRLVSPCVYEGDESERLKSSVIGIPRLNP